MRKMSGCGLLLDNEPEQRCGKRLVVCCEHLILGIVLAVSVPISGAAQAPSSLHDILHTKLDRKLQATANHLRGVMGYDLRDLTTGESFSDGASVVFPTASSIKLAILVTLLRQAQEGKIALNQELTVHRNQTVGGSGILYMLGDGMVHLSWRDLATFMVVLSDNSATNILIDRVGMDNINSESRRLGLAHTLLQRHMMDLKAAQAGRENVSTPRELSELLLKVYGRQALDSAQTKEYFRILSLPKDSEFHSALPQDVTIADKPGSLPGVRCDAGMVFIPGHPLVFTVMTAYLENDADGEAAIERVAQLAYAYFSRLAESNRYGRVN
jgi:beta-lactamase class A